MSSKLQARMI